jgi:hypothetical protein
MITVKQPNTMLPPCAVVSPILAAGLPPISTVADPFTIESGGPVQTSMSPTVAAGKPPMSTVTVPGGKTGPPTCGTTPVTMGHTCMSVILAAKGIGRLISRFLNIFFYCLICNSHQDNILSFR